MTATLRRRLVSGLACCLVAASQLVVQVPAARGAASGAARRVTLAGTTTIVGSTTGAMRVRVPSRVTLDGRHKLHALGGPNRDMRFEQRGNSPYFGFALVEDPYPEARRYGYFLAGGQFALCERPPCRAADTYNDSWATLHEDGKAVLEPGDYTLLLIGEGPMRVKLRLRGLEGAKTVRPPADDFAVIETPATAGTAFGSGELWWGGSEAFGGQVGFSFSLAAARAPDFAGGEFGICQYNALEPPPDDVAYGRHCHAAVEALGSGASYSFDPTGKDENLVFSTSLGYNANENSVGTPNLEGDHGIGVWADVKSPLDYLRFATVFVAIDEID